jgi:succinate dehydrogenase / fumarate reductase flavoprotein subunit
VFNLDMMRTVELAGMIDVALATAAGALARTESRGSHARTDYPTRDDKDWLKHTLAYAGAGGPRLEYKPVTLGTFEPQERKY